MEEKQDINLANLFQQLGDQSEKVEVPDFKLKDAVFSTIDATSLVADIVDLFTVKFVQAQSEVVDAIPESEFGFNEKDRVFKHLEKKYKESKQPQAVEDVPETPFDNGGKNDFLKFLEKKRSENPFE
jgi:hypothetical protein